MNQPEIDDLKKLLKDCLPPAGSVELQHDLWPAMLHRLDQPAFLVPWWDWTLLAAVTALLFFFPGMIPALLYHL
jgi:hypothetical protein